MTAKGAANTSNDKLDTFKWVVVGCLVAAIIVGNLVFSNILVLYRIAGVVVLTALALFVALQTAGGRWTLDFVRKAQVELRKVVWPTRQETLQTTLVVIAIVIATALFLWGLDSLLLWAMGAISGHGVSG